MDQAFKAKLLAYGVDFDAALERFMGNESMYERFLRKLPQEKSWLSLQSAAAAGDVETAQRSAHSLKGVCATLGFTALSAQAAEIEKMYKEHKSEEAVALLPQFASSFEAACQLFQ